MPNKNFAKFTGGGHKEPPRGKKCGDLGPVKTANWPDVPGKTQPKTRNYGYRKVPGGAAEKGV